MKEQDFKKNLLFGYLTCKRLYPNYVFFSKKFNFGQPEVLERYLLDIRNLIANNQKGNFDNFQELIDKITPSPHEFESIFASSALDACAALVELILFIDDKDISHIKAIQTAATDTVDMYLQEKEGWEFDDPSIEEKISFHPLMMRERKCQKDIMEYLDRMVDIDEEDVTTLEKLQDYEGLGNLELSPID